MSQSSKDIDGKVNTYLGNYDDYKEKSREASSFRNGLKQNINQTNTQKK